MISRFRSGIPPQYQQEQPLIPVDQAMRPQMNIEPMQPSYPDPRLMRPRQPGIREAMMQALMPRIITSEVDEGQEKPRKRGNDGGLVGMGLRALGSKLFGL